jgi:hypothetical protein
MEKRRQSQALDQELAEARRLLAEGRHQEALAAALGLLRETLGQLHSSLLVLHRNLAEAKDELAGKEAAQENQPMLFTDKQTRGPYLH